MNDDLCVSAERLSHSVEFRVILLVKALFCAAGIVATLYSLKRHVRPPPPIPIETIF